MATVMERLDASLVEPEELARRLGTDPARGLSRAEAAGRLAAAGPNEIESAPRVAPWCRLLAQFPDPLIYLLLAAVAVSLAASRPPSRPRRGQRGGRSTRS